MNIIRKAKLFLLALLLAATMSLGMTSVALADGAKDEVCSGVSLTGAPCGGGAGNITPVIKAAIQILTLIAGIAAVIMIIVAGLKFITSGGDASAVSSAKNSLVYALVGVVVVALAQFIVHFVLGKV
jgi:Type IV secretion system pilin